MEKKPVFTKYFLGLTILILVASVFYSFNSSSKKQEGGTNNNEDLGYETVDFVLEERNTKLWVADTPDKREKGLMYYRSLENVDGMIFIFDQKQVLHFWNKNTFMDLDLYWLDDDKVIGKSFLPSIEKSKDIVTVSSPSQANRVIEMPAKND